MIDEQRKLIFIHIPRTGGTSIEEQLGYDQEREHADRCKHWTLNDWKNKLSGDLFESCFKFTFVRNPWDIVISKYLDHWYSRRDWQDGHNVQIGYHSGKPLKYFLNNFFSPPHEHGETFHDYFHPEEMDFIGRFETRAKDIKYLSDRLKIDIDPDVKSRASTDKKHYTQYYNDETREMVARRYAKDIEYFGYKFGD